MAWDLTAPNHYLTSIALSHWSEGINMKTWIYRSVEQDWKLHFKIASRSHKDKWVLNPKGLRDVTGSRRSFLFSKIPFDKPNEYKSLIDIVICKTIAILYLVLYLLMTSTATVMTKFGASIYTGLEIQKFDYPMAWNWTRRLWNVGAIGLLSTHISRLRDYTRSYCKTPYQK